MVSKRFTGHFNLIFLAIFLAFLVPSISVYAEPVDETGQTIQSSEETLAQNNANTEDLCFEDGEFILCSQVNKSDLTTVITIGAVVTVLAIAGGACLIFIKSKRSGRTNATRSIMSQPTAMPQQPQTQQQYPQTVSQQPGATQTQATQTQPQISIPVQAPPQVQQTPVVPAQVAPVLTPQASEQPAASNPGQIIEPPQ